jgi:hypothetical protein
LWLSTTIGDCRSTKCAETYTRPDAPAASKKQATQSVIAKFASAHFQLKFGTGKLGRISKENQSQTSNREGSRVTTLALMQGSK